MIVLYILAGIVILIILILCIPIGAAAEYGQDGAVVTLVAGPVHIRLYPGTGKEKPKKPKKAKKAKKPKKAKAKSKKAAGETEKKKFDLGGSLPMFRELLGLLPGLLSGFRNRLRIRQLTLHLNFGGKGEDPAGAAILYGRAWAAIGALWPQLERFLRIRQPDIQANVDFSSEETTVYAKATAVIPVGSILRIGITYGVRGLKIYLKHQKKLQQGGKKHGTSNQ